jgi:hypothetical protein
MPNHQDVQDLIQAYDGLYFWQKWLFPGKLKQAITSSAPTNFFIYKSFVDSVWFFQRWLIGCLSRFSNSSLMNFCERLEFLNILTQENVNAASNQANFNAVIGHPDPENLAWALRGLNNPGLLRGDPGQDNFNAVIGHPDLYGFAWALDQLNRAGLLSGDLGQANFNAVIRHAYPGIFGWALFLLNRARLLTGEAEQTNFNALIEHTPILFGSDDVRELWARIPRITEGQFTEIIAICSQHVGRRDAGIIAFANYVNQVIIPMRAQGVVADGVGLSADQQSTHTASVHEVDAAQTSGSRYAFLARKVDRGPDGESRSRTPVANGLS